jgi:hypothetical protein
MGARNGAGFFTFTGFCSGVGARVDGELFFTGDTCFASGDFFADPFITGLGCFNFDDCSWEDPFFAGVGCFDFDDCAWEDPFFTGVGCFNFDDCAWEDPFFAGVGCFNFDDCSWEDSFFAGVGCFDLDDCAWEDPFFAGVICFGGGVGMALRFALPRFSTDRCWAISPLELLSATYRRIGTEATVFTHSRSFRVLQTIEYSALMTAISSSWQCPTV